MIRSRLPLLGLPPSDEPVQNGLVGWWPLGAGYAVDFSGNQNNGVVLNNPTPVAGADGGGGALLFNGTSQGVSIAVNPRLLGLGANAPATLASWVKLTSNQDGILLGKVEVGKECYHLRVSRAGNNLFELRHVVNGATAVAVSSTTTCSSVVGRWIHIAGVADGTNLIIYVDGLREAATAYTPGPLNTANTFWGIAKDIANNGTYLNGAVDDPRVYDRALSPGEVNALYSGGLASAGETNLPAVAIVTAAASGTLAATEAADVAAFAGGFVGPAVVSGALTAFEITDAASLAGSVQLLPAGSLVAVESVDLALIEMAFRPHLGASAAPYPAIQDYGWKRRLPPIGKRRN